MVSARPSGNRLPSWAGSTFMTDVAAAGVGIHLYEKGYLHAKTISIDSEICSIGSANIDIRSFIINYELNPCSTAAGSPRAWRRTLPATSPECSAFDPVRYRQANIAVRFRDSAARLLSPLL